jgi:hypothetical protein
MKAVAAAMDLVRVLAEATSGYYTTLVAAGVPAEPAGRMTEEFHHKLISVLKLS